MSAGGTGPRKPDPRNPDVEEDYGYGYYPSRSQYSQEMEEKPKHWFIKLNERREAKEFQCAANIADCLQNNKKVKLLLSGLKKHGCNFDPKRHISCEDCVSKVNGGYDIVNNQVVICKNNSASKVACCSVLTHELIHMFDACRAKLDFKNIDHVACTEIRASAICHCRFLTAMKDGIASFFNFKKRHQECVKEKATLSVLMVRNVTYEEARGAVERVFTRCYNDLEPFGRIPRMSSEDAEKMYIESLMHGY